EPAFNDSIPCCNVELVAVRSETANWPAHSHCACFNSIGLIAESIGKPLSVSIPFRGQASACVEDAGEPVQINRRISRHDQIRTVSILASVSANCAVL